MRIQQTIIMATGILLTIGCSLMIDQPKGDLPSESDLRSERKSLAGIYPDIDSNGSIKPHPQVVGEGGRIDGHGGPAVMPDVKAGTMRPKEPADTIPPSVKMGDTTFTPESNSKGMGSLKKPPEAGNK